MANFFDQFDVVTPEQAGPPPETRITVGGPSSQAGANYFDQFDEPSAPDITGTGGLGYAEQQFAELPPFMPADQQRMGDLASAYRAAEPGRGMAVDQRVQHLQDTTDPYSNATWQGLTFGFGDEVGAGIRTAFGQMDGYGENLAIERELLRRQRQERPIGMAGAEIVGAAIPAFLLPGAGAAATTEQAAARAPGFLDRAADAAGMGAAYGGLYGVGSGEGFEGRLQKGIEDAGYGAIAGAVGQPVVEGAIAGGRAAVNAVGDYVAPLYQSGREALAARVLNDSAADPAAFRQALANPEQIVPSVPGSQPTTFQQTGDMGAGLLERQIQTANPQPFLAREAEQSIARNNALAAIQPTGSPEAVVSTMRQQLARLDQETQTTLDRVTRAAQEKASRLGGQRAPEDYGSSLRHSLSAAEDTARTRERALWEAVDPDGTLALPADIIRNEVVSVLRTLPKAAKPMEGEERSIFSTAAGFKGVVPFREVSALRTRVSTDMRRELSRYGSTPVYARLAQLRGAIERTIEDAVAGKASQEAAAVASGAMRQEDTMAAALLRDIQGWHERRAAEAGMGQNAGAVGGGDAVGRAGGAYPISGGQVPRGSEFRNASRTEGLQGDTGLQPNFDEAALGRLREATEATKARANTYGTKPVGDVLRRSGQEGPFTVPAASVPARFFRPGPRSYEDVQALRRAAADPQTMKTIRDYAISTLRRFAEGQDGTLDPSKVTIWRQRHQDALRAIPEIDRMLKGPIEASETMARVALARKAELDEYQAGAVARLIGLDNAADVTRAVGAVFDARNPVQLMRQLAGEVKGNLEAEAGLRKAVADHMVQRLRSMTEAGTTGEKQLQAAGFQKFVTNNEAALQEVLKPGEVSMLKAIAADLERSQRSVSGVKLPGRSNSPQDILAQMKAAGAPQSMFGRLLSIGAQAGVGGAAGGPMGSAAAVIAGEFLSRLRQAGFQQVEEILADALLNPSRALLLLQQAPEKVNKKTVADIANRFRLAAPAVASATDGGE